MIAPDENFGKAPRKFYINIPETYDHTQETSVLFYMHSQGESGIENAHYLKKGNRKNFITVYPQGMADYQLEGKPYPGWNVPISNTNTGQCTPKTETMCYDSCRALGRCGKCAWTTCYDDLLFMRTLVSKVKDELCINDSRVYLAGCSNGGMFTYYLSQQMADVFKGFIIESAQPLVGQMHSPPALKGSDLLTLHGREDGTIPLVGGLDSDNMWIYNSVGKMTLEWAKTQGCDLGSY